MIFILILFPFFIIIPYAAVLYFAGRSLVNIAENAPDTYNPTVPTENLIVTSNTPIDDIKVECNFTAAHSTGKRVAPPKMTFKIDQTVAHGLFLSPELEGDIYLKKLGLSQETEVGDSAIDNYFHIVAEDETFVKNWIAQDQVRTLLLELVQTPGFGYLTFTDQGCELHFASFNLLAGSDFEAVNDEQARKLATLVAAANRLQTVAKSTGIKDFSKKVELYTSKVPNYAARFVSIVGIVAYTLLTGFNEHSFHISEETSLLVLTAVVLFVLLGYAAKAKIRNLQLPSKTFFSLLYSSFVSFVVAVLFLGYFGNIFLDRTKGELVKYTIVNKYTREHKQSVSYYVAIDTTKQSVFQSNTQTEFSVNANEFFALTPGKAYVLLESHPGFFHIPWFNNLGITRTAKYIF